MRHNLVLITAPTVEPVIPAQLQAQCRLDQVVAAEAALLESKLKAAREACESYTGRQLIEATWELRLDRFPECGDAGEITDGEAIVLPRPPLRELVSIKYVDTTGVQQTLASSSYQVDPPAGQGDQRAYISPAFGESWPATRVQLGAVVVQFKAGYGTSAEAVPAFLVEGILLQAADAYEQREDRPSDAAVRASERIWAKGRAW